MCYDVDRRGVLVVQCRYVLSNAIQGGDAYSKWTLVSQLQTEKFAGTVAAAGRIEG